MVSARSDYPELGRLSNGFDIDPKVAATQANLALDELARLRGELAAHREVEQRRCEQRASDVAALVEVDQEVTPEMHWAGDDGHDPQCWCRTDEEDTPGPCGACDHDPACGFASIYQGGVETWYCHDDDHTCYAGSAAS